MLPQLALIIFLILFRNIIVILKFFCITHCINTLHDHTQIFIQFLNKHFGDIAFLVCDMARGFVQIS